MASPEINDHQPNPRTTLIAFGLGGALLMSACGATTESTEYTPFPPATTFVDNSLAEIPQIGDPVEVIVRADPADAVVPAERSETPETPKMGTVAVYGDSIVSGYNLAGDRFTDILGTYLLNDPVLSQVKIENHAVAGQAIISNHPLRFDEDGELIGGRLIDKLIQTYPADSPGLLPDMVVIIPSINEIVGSDNPYTPESRAQHAIDGLLLAKAYLENMGTKVVVTTMLETVPGWGSSTGVDINGIIGIFNKMLVLSGFNPLDYTLDFDKIPGGDDEYYELPDSDGKPNDGLHPDKNGQDALAETIFGQIRELLISSLQPIAAKMIKN